MGLLYLSTFIVRGNLHGDGSDGGVALVSVPSEPRRFAKREIEAPFRARGLT